jgi:hypothetical protein
MITPILQRAPGANPGDPIREPEITWRDLVGVRDGHCGGPGERGQNLGSGKGLRPFCSIRDREIVAGSALYKRLRFSLSALSNSHLFLIGGNQSEPECLNETGRAIRRQPPTGWNEHERRPSIRRHDR